MPGMDGYELARRATVARPGLQVIMVSGPEIDGRGVASRPKAVLQQDLAAAEPRLEPIVQRDRFSFLGGRIAGREQ